MLSRYSKWLDNETNRGMGGQHIWISWKLQQDLCTHCDLRHKLAVVMGHRLQATYQDEE